MLFSPLKSDFNLLSNLILKFVDMAQIAPCVHYSFGLVSAPKRIYFVPVQIQFILNELYLIYFPVSIFFFSQKSRFWDPPSIDTPKIVKI